MKKILLGLMCGLVLLAVSAMSFQAQRAGTLAGLVEAQLANGKVVTFRFKVPLTGTNQTLITTDDKQVSIGDDYICFGEAWNVGEVKQSCTPLENLHEVSFTELE